MTDYTEMHKTYHCADRNRFSGLSIPTVNDSTVDWFCACVWRGRGVMSRYQMVLFAKATSWPTDA